MNCPKCEYDLSILENYDNINCYHNCIGCGIELFLDYDECCDEDYIDCYDMFEWKIKKED